MPLLMGLGLRHQDGFQNYATYSFVSSAIIFVSGLTGVILAGQGFHVFGLFERITIGSFEIWILVTAWKLLKIAKENSLKRNAIHLATENLHADSS